MMLALRVWNRWLTFETGQVGDTNEPDIKTEEKEEEPEEEKVPVVKKALGFTMLDPYRDE